MRSLARFSRAAKLPVNREKQPRRLLRLLEKQLSTESTKPV
jgi:hypothetical protein